MIIKTSTKLWNEKETLVRKKNNKTINGNTEVCLRRFIMQRKKFNKEHWDFTRIHSSSFASHSTPLEGQWMERLMKKKRKNPI